MNTILNSSYHFHANSAKNIRIRKEITKIIESYFSGAILLSNPTFDEKSEELTISLFYYTNSYNFSKKGIEVLTNKIAQFTNKKVSIVLTRVHYPYMNSAILAKFLAHNAPANTFVHFHNAILKYPKFVGTSLPSHISGIRIQVSGRLVTERVIPRVTTNSSVFGSLSNADYIDYTHYTTKNYLGTFTIKV